MYGFFFNTLSLTSVFYKVPSFAMNCIIFQVNNITTGVEKLFFQKLWQQVFLLKLTIILSALFFNNLAMADTFGLPNAISFYGTSSHNDNNNGEGYNERNLGLGAKWINKKNDKNIYTYYEIGIFENSFYDKTLWVALGVNYEVSNLIDIGINLRHWETEKGTYQNRFVVPYPLAKIKVSQNFSLNFIVRKAGSIFFVDYEF